MKWFKQSHHALIQSNEMLEDNGQLTGLTLKFQKALYLRSPIHTILGARVSNLSTMTIEMMIG